MPSFLDQALSGVVLLALLAGSHGAKLTCAQQTKPRLCLRVLKVGEPLPDNLDAGLNIPETQINKHSNSKDNSSLTSNPAKPSHVLALIAESAGEPSSSPELWVSRANEEKNPDKSQSTTTLGQTQQEKGNSSAADYQQITEHTNESSTTATSIYFVKTNQAKESNSNEFLREVTKASTTTNSATKRESGGNQSTLISDSIAIEQAFMSNSSTEGQQGPKQKVGNGELGSEGGPFQEYLEQFKVVGPKSQPSDGKMEDEKEESLIYPKNWTGSQDMSNDSLNVTGPNYQPTEGKRKTPPIFQGTKVELAGPKSQPHEGQIEEKNEESPRPLTNLEGAHEGPNAIQNDGTGNASSTIEQELNEIAATNTASQTQEKTVTPMEKEEEEKESEIVIAKCLKIL